MRTVTINITVSCTVCMCHAHHSCISNTSDVVSPLLAAVLLVVICVSRPYLLLAYVWHSYSLLANIPRVENLLSLLSFCFSGNVTSSNATTVLNCTNTTNLKIGLNLLTEDALDQTLHIKATNQWNIALNLLLLWYRWAEACNYFVKSPHDDEWGQCKWHYCIQHLKRITQIVALITRFWMRPYWHPNSTFSLVVLMRSQSTANENHLQLR